jgi:hypothetical protein
MTADLFKYPRTRHLQGSRLGPGDEDLSQVPVESLRGHYLVIEEKVDGANSGLSFDSDANLLLQCRGHYLVGGSSPTEAQFNLFKRWAGAHQDAFFDRLTDRYVLFGEWLYAKHSVYYDALTHYFMEYDVWDREKRVFLSTKARRRMLNGLPLVSVPVLYEGEVTSIDQVRDLIKRSRYKTDQWKANLMTTALKLGLDPRAVMDGTDPEDLAEGVYLKDETDDLTVDRYKFVRPSFVTRLVEQNRHWAATAIVPNKLAPGVDIFALEITP